jgi:oxygen-dependent protoporphyrinogen oxidase
MIRNSANSLPVAVVGGGISGLAAANHLIELDRTRPVRLLEAGERLGGVLGTNREKGFVWETAADGFRSGPSSALDLCRRIGLGGQILRSQSGEESTQIIHRGKLVATPMMKFFLGAAPSAQAILRTPLLSWHAKVRVFVERWVPPDSSHSDESCAAFFIRRFGREFYERLVEPVLSGIYSADPSSLSTQALLPRLRRLEWEWGSLTRAFHDQRRRMRGEHCDGQHRANKAWTLQQGMCSLVSALAERLPRGAIQVNAPVHHLQLANDHTWRIEYGTGQTLLASSVVIATPAHRAGDLLRSLDPAAARLLRQICYSSSAVCALGYRRAQIRRPLTSMGFFVPATEPFVLRSASFASLKFSGRAPADTVLIRAFVHPDRSPALTGCGDAPLVRLVHNDLTRLLDIDDGPIFAQTHRQMFALPQYRVGHTALIADVCRRLARLPGLALAGNAYSGIGVPHCIVSGEQAAEDLHGYLTTKPCGRLLPKAVVATATVESAHA